MDFLKRGDEILSVGEFSQRFKMLVKLSIPELWLRGEVSNLKTYSSGHTYFTLKDDQGAISAVLFKGYAQSIKLSLREGMRILVYGEISVYEVRGTYQMLVKAAMPDGEGDLALRFEELKRKLAAEGLFDESKKREIPPLPERVAVVTSPTGAAIRDFISILRRRDWRGEVVVLPSKVQGEGAAEEIAGAVKTAQNMDFDLLILMRGGGSLEDLWSFNEEIVARAVAASKIPTISAVGHEIDFTLSDFAADLRAETPSAAAEFISSKFLEIREAVRGLASDISLKALQILREADSKLKAQAELFRLSSPASKLANFEIKMDECEAKLNASAASFISEKRHAFLEIAGQLKEFSILTKLELFAQKLDSAERELGLLSVESVLKRGFSMAISDGGKILKRAKDAPEEAPFKLRFFDSEIEVNRTGKAR